MITKICAGMLLMLISLGPSLAEQTPPPNPQPGAHYLLLDEKKIAIAGQKLADAAANGYHVVAVAPKMKDGFASGVSIILEENREGTPAREYMLLDSRTDGLSGRVDEASAKGYRVVTRGGFEHKSHDFGRDFAETFFPSLIEQATHSRYHVSTIDHTKYDVHTAYLLMERGGNQNAAACGYSLITPSQSALLENMVAGKNRIVAAEGSLWVIEACAAGAEPDATVPEPLTIRSLPLSGKLQKDQNQLSLAVADGFHVSYAAGPHLTLEKGSSPVPPREYQIVSNSSASSLQKLLNSTGQFRLVSGSLWVKVNVWGTQKLFALLEKTSHPTIAYRYKVLQSDITEDIQNDLNRAAEQGYTVSDLVRDGTGTTVVLEATR
jgi:hypothetical protein